MVIRQRPLAAVAIAAAGLVSSAAAAGVFGEDDQAAILSRGAAHSQSRLLKRRRKRVVHQSSTTATNDERRRRLDFLEMHDDDVDDDGHWNLAFDTIDDFFELNHELSMPSPATAPMGGGGGAGQSVCKSIIAVGGIRRLDAVNDDVILSDDDDVELVYEDAEDVETDEEFMCELKNGQTVPIAGTVEQVEEMRSLLNEGQLVSAMSSVEVMDSPAVEAIGADTHMTDDIQQQTVSLPPGGVKLINNGGRRLANDDGSNKYEGTKKALVVRVTDRDGRAIPEDAKHVSDKFFGTYGDKATMKSGFEACSFGKLTMTNDYGDAVDASQLSAPGVVDVKINIALTESSQPAISSAVRAAVQSKLKLALPGPFDHVIMVVESCHEIQTNCAFAAWAYVNSWLSLFVGENYMYPAVAIHELGHNLNLAHSGGIDGRTYTDHTCMMGNPLFEDDVSKMCYNPVKNYQIAVSGESWYDERHIKVFDSGTGGSTSWRGNLIGVADYDNNPSDSFIAIKLETGTASDWFLGLNRATGINSDNQQASDLVTVYKVKAGDGLGYSQSMLKGFLRPGRTATIRQWRGSGKDLYIQIYDINLNESPGYADVEITFGSQPEATSKPTNEPTNEPTSMPTNEPTNQPSIPPTNSPSEPTPQYAADPTPRQSPRPTKKTTPVHIRFRTRSEPDDHANGQMFTITASKQMRVKSFDLVGKKNGDSEVLIYTRPGEYHGYEDDPSGWELVLDKSVELRRGDQTNTGALKRKVTIAQGSSQSFFIFTKRGMQCTKGTGEKFRYASDGALAIVEGIGTKKLFQGSKFDARFSGGVRYEL